MNPQQQQHQFEIDAYWAEEAAKAYAERKAWVAECLRESQGIVQEWMFYQITLQHLVEILVKYPKIKLPKDREIAQKIKSAIEQKRRES